MLAAIAGLGRRVVTGPHFSIASRCSLATTATVAATSGAGSSAAGRNGGCGSAGAAGTAGSSRESPTVNEAYRTYKGPFSGIAGKGREREKGAGK
jgi:hypothetical protein